MDIPRNARYPKIYIREKIGGWQTSLSYRLDDGTKHEFSWPLRTTYDLAHGDAVRTIGERCDVVVKTVLRQQQQMAAE
ncbi:MAG TPA: hypothetical protein VMH91_04245 [Candidatus Paceibacterota bacterium]|nr:hypothetical protein [Candidatus Paceibacterota bacterium]